MKILSSVLAVVVALLIFVLISPLSDPSFYDDDSVKSRGPQDIVDTRRMNHEDIAWQVNVLGADKYWCRDLCGEKYLNFDLSLEEFKLCNYRCNK